MRRKLLPTAIAAFTLIFLALLSHRLDFAVPGRLRTKKPADASEPSAHTHAWMRISALLEQYKPTCPSPERIEPAGAVSYNATTYPRPELLRMPAEDVAHMRQAHQAFVANISAPEAGAALLTFESGTRGIVTTAGGRYLPVLVISIRMLRRTGSTLPVEVFLLSNDEYESHACEVVLPRLDARCVVLGDILRSAALSVDIPRFALKTFALAFSSFDDMLFLDADCFPLRDPGALLDSDPYASKGLVTWPDFWRNTMSPQYFEIGEIEAPEPGLRASSETGEILMSKTRHAGTLLLALYYNIFGPSHYYPLLSQGAMGEGDKETFLAAAMRLGLPFHAVAEPVRAIGHRRDNGYLSGSAMIQYDPAEDYALTGDQPGIPTEWDSSQPAKVRPFFVHANFPKFNPATIFHSPVNPTRTEDGRATRPWLDEPATVASLGEGLERHFWDEIRWTACELETKFKSWEGKHDICKNTTEYQREAFGGELSELQKSAVDLET